MKLNPVVKDFISWKEFWADHDPHDNSYYLDATEEEYTLDSLFTFYYTYVKGVDNWRKLPPCKD
jgi:hypothetical protein